MKQIETRQVLQILFMNVSHCNYVLRYNNEYTAENTVKNMLYAEPFSINNDVAYADPNETQGLYECATDVPIQTTVSETTFISLTVDI